METLMGLFRKNLCRQISVKLGGVHRSNKGGVGGVSKILQLFFFFVFIFVMFSQWLRILIGIIWF